MTTSASSRNGSSELNTARFGHAVVIGSGIAGLTAARVLSSYFRQVTLIERDSPPIRLSFGVACRRHVTHTGCCRAARQFWNSNFLGW